MRNLLLVVLALSACSRESADPRALTRDETLVQTSGTARAETRPDEARFAAGVSTIAATGPAASEANARKMNAVAAAVIATGVSERDIQTQQLSVGRIGYGPNRGRLEATNTVLVRVRAVDKVGAAVAAATGGGANILSGPDLRVGDPAAATRTAHAQAYRAARIKAEAYAAAAGLKVVRVLAIRDVMGANPSTYESLDRAVLAPVVRPQAPPVFAGTNEEQVAVSADFALAR